MIIPKPLVERDAFYDDLIRKCLVSQEDRRLQYQILKNFYLFGVGPNERMQPGNKIGPHIDTLGAFLFSPETTKFIAQFGPEVPQAEWEKIPVVSRAVNTEWLNSNGDLVAGMTINWSLVYNSCFVKLIPDNKQMQPWVVEPGMMGVLREDIPFLDDQEAFVHCYHLTKSQLESKLFGHTKKADILKNVQVGGRQYESELDGLNRIVIVASSPTMQGTAPGADPKNLQGFRPDYQPNVAEELIEMYDLYVKNDETKDYQVITAANATGAKVTIYDRTGREMFLKGEHPFIHFCPNPMYQYFWGQSEVEKLVQLQMWRNRRILQMEKLLDLQVAPPKAMLGFNGILDEKWKALFAPEGIISAGMTGMEKVQDFKPEMPADMWTEIREIDNMFDETSGMQNILMGKGTPGVRSGRQTSELGRFASARVKKRALTIEDALERMATLYLKWMRAEDTREYVYNTGEGKKINFVMSQVPPDFVVKVDGHSNSPLFVEDHRKLAAELLEAHCITRERFIELNDPPGKELMVLELKVIEKKEAAAQQAQQQAEAAKHAPK